MKKSSVSGILFRVRLVRAAASREFTGSMGLLLSLQSAHRKLPQFRIFEIIIYLHKMTAHSMQSLSLEGQLIWNLFPLNSCCHGLMPSTLRLAPVPADLHRSPYVFTSYSSASKSSWKGPHTRIHKVNCFLESQIQMLLDESMLVVMFTHNVLPPFFSSF